MNITIYAEASFTNTLAKKGQELLTKIHLNMLVINPHKYYLILIKAQTQFLQQCYKLNISQSPCILIDSYLKISERKNKTKFYIKKLIYKVHSRIMSNIFSFLSSVKG